MVADVRFGYALSSEEHRPRALVANAVRAEQAGFEFAMISDHFHPWIDRQGQSPFVWSILGGIASSTERITIGTGVTALSQRIHPAILAQAAATTADMLPGRFWFGVGTGEALNEHILGDPWPEHELRVAMLEEAIGIIRTLWKGRLFSLRGSFYDVVRARIYTVPAKLPPILVAAGGPEMATVARRVADGLIGTGPEKELIAAYGGRGPKVGQVSVCWAKDEKAARRTALDVWPTAAIHGDSGQELSLPSSFESLAQLVTEDAIAEAIACGPDPEVHVAKVKAYIDAGYDHVYLHQVGPDQAGFFRFAEEELLPRLGGGSGRSRRRRAA
jgi:coenzyme F420-dependent glucose-6-phosphate dehydrogenase